MTLVWICAVILVGATCLATGSRIFPSQDRDEAREWERELAAGEPPQPWPVTCGEAQWNDTVENILTLSRAHYEPLARGADGLETPVSPVPGLPESPIFDALVAEFAAHKLPGPAMVADEMSGRHGDLAHETAGPGPDPLFDALDDTGAFALINFELKYLKVLAAEPFGLTPWKGAIR